MRFRTPEIFLGCLLTVAVFSIGVLFSSQYPQQSAQAPAHQEAASNSNAAKNPDAELTGSTWLTKDAAGFFTFALVIVGGLQAILFLAQLRLIRESLAPAKEAADAAKEAAGAANLNAEAVINSERAYLFVDIGADVAPVMEQAAEFDESSPAKFTLKITYAFKNYGRTPALIREIGCGTCITPDLPHERIYSPAIHLPAHLLAADKATSNIPVDDVPKVTVADAKSIREIENTFWFYGFVTYEDMFEWRRTFSFVWHYSAVSEGFTLFSWEETKERREN